jgi:lipopolysaccharide O-acetyltransferase
MNPFELIFSYGLFGSIRLVLSIIISRLFFKNVRIIRLPFYIRGSKYIKFGKGFTAGNNIRLDTFFPGSIEFGNNVQVNDYVHIAAVKSIKIGDNVLIASKVYIGDHNHGDYNNSINNCEPFIPPAVRPLSSKPVIIHKNVWIGESVCILPGVVIGEGSVIGAGSIVSKSIPSNTVATGNPIKLIKQFNFTTMKWDNINNEK